MSKKGRKTEKAVSYSTKRKEVNPETGKVGEAVVSTQLTQKQKPQTPSPGRVSRTVKKVSEGKSPKPKRGLVPVSTYRKR